MDKRPQLPPALRDTILFVAGLLGVAHETIVEHSERPSLLILYAGMLGLPIYLRKNGIK